MANIVQYRDRNSFGVRDAFEKSVMTLARYAHKRHPCDWNHAGLGEVPEKCEAILNCFEAYQKHILTHCKSSRKSSLDQELWHCGLPRCSGAMHQTIGDLETHLRKSHLQRLPLLCPAIGCNQSVRHHDTLPDHYLQKHGQHKAAQPLDNLPSVRSGYPHQPVIPQYLSPRISLRSFPAYLISSPVIRPSKLVTRPLNSSTLPLPPSTPTSKHSTRKTFTPNTVNDTAELAMEQSYTLNNPPLSLDMAGSLSNGEDLRIKVKISQRIIGPEPVGPPAGRRNIAAKKWYRDVRTQQVNDPLNLDYKWEYNSALVLKNPVCGPLDSTVGFKRLYDTWKETPEARRVMKETKKGKQWKVSGGARKVLPKSRSPARWDR